MIQINPLQSYIDGGARAAITTPPSASLVFDLPGKAIWVKGVKLKGTDHTYTFSHDNYITLTNTPDLNNPESEDIKIGVNITTLKAAIDTTYSTGTLAQLTAGTNTTALVWTAKILAQYVTGVLPVTKKMKVNGTDYAIFTTESSLPSFFAPATLGTAGQILSCTANGLVWVNQTVNTDYQVTQSSIATNADYRVILKRSANDTAETTYVNFATTLTYNPSTKILKINGNRVVTFADIYVGATSSADATTGLVPIASSANRNKFLRGDGTWQVPTNDNTWRPIQVGSSEKLGSATNTGALNFVAGTGIEVSWDATNKAVVITNSAPDVNHNTDRTGIKLGTVSGTKKTDGTVIINNSATGLNIVGGTNKFSIGDGTNYIEVPITPSFTVSNKAAIIGTSLTTIATINGTDITAKIASYVPFETSSTLASINDYNHTPIFYVLSGTEMISGYGKYWYVINMGKHTGGNHGAQIALNYSNESSNINSEMFIRKAKNDTWEDWVRVLHSKNWSSYITWDTLPGKPNTFTPSPHSHNYIDSLGDVAPETGRTHTRGGVYTYRPYSNSAGGPSTYGAVIGFGWGTRGSGEIWTDWCGGGIWYRTLRDCCEDWYPWRRIIDSSNIGSQSVNYANSAGSVAWDNITGKPSTFPPSAHTHPLSIVADSGTSSIALAASTKYKLTAGGSTYVFTSTPDENVKQTDNNNNQDSPILLKNGTGTGQITSGTIFADGVTVNPSTNSLKVSGSASSIVAIRGHRLGYRHLDAGPKSSWSDSRLYIGYNGFSDDDGVTESIGFYRSTGTGTYTRTLWAEINSNGLYANTRFGVNGQNTGYNFYVNGSSYMNGSLLMNGNISFSNSGTGFRGINYGTMGDNDLWRIGGAATGSNAGYMEIATADDATEPIYVRQYTGVFANLIRTASLLDASGNTSFPGVVTANRFVSNVATGTQPYACTSTTVNTNLNADLLDGFHYTSFVYELSKGYLRNGPYYTKIATKDMTGVTWGAGALILALYSSGYSNGTSYLGTVEIQWGHWNNTDIIPTITCRWILKGPRSNDKYIAVVRDDPNKKVDIYIQNDLWDSNMYYQIIHNNNWDILRNEPYVTLPTATTDVLIYRPSIATYVGDLTGNASTASKWATARTLALTGSVTGSASIDGSGNVSLATTTNHAHAWSDITGKPGAVGSASIPVYWTGSGFGTCIVSFGNSSNGEHNANNITDNGIKYYTSNGPSGLGEQSTDGALYSQAYNTSWVAQIAQDYRNGGLYVRGKNNGTWQSWYRVWDNRTTYVSGGKGYIGSTEITQVNNADTVDSLHASDFVRAYGTTNDNIDSDWGQSFKTFDPIPLGNPPAQNPNISTINIGDNFIRRKQLAFLYNVDDIYYRRRTDGGWNGWKKIAFTSDIPTVNNASLTLLTAGTTQTTFYANDSTNRTFNVTCANIGAATSGHTHRYINSSGFSDNGSTTLSTWGTLTSANSYTAMLNINESGGGSWEIAAKSGQISMQIDGYYYQNEGRYRTTDVTETVTALGTSGNYLTWTKNGSTNNITVPYATNSDTVDGYHASALNTWKDQITGTALTWSQESHGCKTYSHYTGNPLGSFRQLVVFKNESGGTGLMFNAYWCVNPTDSAASNNIYFRVKRDAASDWGPYTRLILGDGNQTINGTLTATHFYEPSDMRLKHDISMISKSIRKFRFNSDNKLYYGFIAQELETLHPELVDNSGEYKKVNYNSAICYYIAELENKVQKLEDEINKLKNK